MRRLLSFEVAGEALGATLDGPTDEARTGVLMVTGGSQTRVGSHRLYERLAAALAREGLACFRFDRRGVGDSSGEDPGYRGSAADLEGADQAFRAACPRLEKVIGFGLCDGATALALFARAGRLDGLILVNPWLVETEADAPPPAAIRRRYREQLLSLSGWRRLLTGAVDLKKLRSGLRRALSRKPSGLAAETAAALRSHGLPVMVLLARGDATAIAAEAEIKSPLFKGVAIDIQTLSTDSHTFARDGDEAALLDAVRRAVARLA